MGIWIEALVIIMKDYIEASSALSSLPDGALPQSEGGVVSILRLYCPSLYIQAKVACDPLLKEAARTALLEVGVEQIDDLEGLLREMVVGSEGRDILISAESRFVTIKEFIQRARGAQDVAKKAEAAMWKYCKSLMGKISDANAEPLLREIAESSLSLSLFGKPGADFHYSKTFVEEHLDEVTPRLRSAELHYLEMQETINKFERKKEVDDRVSSADVINSLKRGISRFNIFFVLILIGGLAAAAIYLTKDALALIAASIGAAISHLLAERNALIGSNNQEGAAPQNGKKS